MIKITGSIKRAFIFPAEIPITMSFFSQLEHIVQYLPHISLIDVYQPNQVRVLYSTEELGAYTFNVYCDIRANLHREQQMLLIEPMADVVPVPAEATMNSATGQGYFALEATFFPLQEQTRIEYHLRLAGRLERPKRMRLMPRRVVDRLAKSVTNGRIREMADGFIKQSIADFPRWLKTEQAEGKLP